MVGTTALVPILPSSLSWMTTTTVTTTRTTYTSLLTNNLISLKPILQASVDDEIFTTTNDADTFFPQAEMIEFVLPKHRPLGCTVEESLADNDVAHHVFVSKVRCASIVI